MSEPFANKPGPNNPGSNKPGVYNPIRIGDGNGENNSADHFESPLVRVFAALLFTAIFTVVWERPEFGPVTMLVLAGCLLHRLEPWQRKVAAAPLILAAIRLCLLLPAYVADWTGGINIFGTTPSRVPGGDSGIPWLPAFLSVCLFYLPKRDSITLKIVAVEAMAVILSSLLPGEGFLSVLGIFHYTLFFAISIGLILDLKPGVRSLFASGFDPASVRVYRPSATPPPPRPAV